MKTLLDRKFVVPSLIILAVLVVVVTLLAPTDKILGEATRMVYVHGAIIRVVLGAFLLSGILGVIYLFSKKPALYDWSRIVQETSLLLWIPYLLSALISTLQTWGAIAWFEPRWLVTLQISVVAPLAFIISLIVKNRSVTAALNAVVAAAVLILTRNAGVVLHPIDPIGTSGDVGIIGSYLVLLGLCTLFATQIARGLRFWQQAQPIKTGNHRSLESRL